MLKKRMQSMKRTKEERVMETRRSTLSQHHRLIHKTSDYSSEDGEWDSQNSTPPPVYSYGLDENARNQLIEDARAAVKNIAGSANGAISAALGLYRKAGRYWEKYPKTDWTYSENSRDRVELEPGVVAMPNMSRPTIHAHVIDKYTSTEGHSGYDTNRNWSLIDSDNVSSSYAVDRTTANGDTESNLLAYQNETETDDRRNYSHAYFRHYDRNFAHYDSTHSQSDSDKWTTNINPHAVQTVSSNCNRLRFMNLISYFLTAFFSPLNSGIFWCVRQLYQFVCTVMLWDTWLLTRHKYTHSRSLYGDRDLRSRMTPILWLCAIPLLLCAAWWAGSVINPFSIAVVSWSTLTQSIGGWSNKWQYVPSTIGGQSINIQDLVMELEQSFHFQNYVRNTVQTTAKIKHDDDTDDLIQLKALLEQMQSQHNYQRDQLLTLARRCCGNNNIHRDIHYTARHFHHHVYPTPSSDCNSKSPCASKYIFDNEQVIRTMVREELDDLLNNRHTIAHATTRLHTDNGLQEEMRNIVADALRIYDADKTGRVDYAMEPMGGQVVTTRCTQNYNAGTAVISILGVPIWYPTNSPRTVITPTLSPGQCWAFENFPGFLVIKLSSRIRVRAVSIEHISRLLVPNGRVDSAPKHFQVFGLHPDENDKQPTFLGEFQYDIGLHVEPLQTFNIAPNSTAAQQPFQMVELRILSNHGNPNYTCLYRFRVHGTVA